MIEKRNISYLLAASYTLHRGWQFLQTLAGPSWRDKDDVPFILDYLTDGGYSKNVMITLYVFLIDIPFIPTP